MVKLFRDEVGDQLFGEPTEERHLQVVEDAVQPVAPELLELAFIANAQRDLEIAKKMVAKRVELLSVIPREIQIQASELIK